MLKVFFKAFSFAIVNHIDCQSDLRASARYAHMGYDHFLHRFMVECRYPNTEHMTLASAGFMVMNPVLPSTASSEGLYGVQLRIAEGWSFLSSSAFVSFLLM